MAFGLGSIRRSRDAGVVALVAETSQFNREIDQAERNWTQSVQSMSREAIKLDLAQERLQRSLHRYGAESTQAKRAILGLKDAEEAATRSARGLDRATGRAQLGTAGLGRSVGLLSAGLVGAGGFAYAVRSSLGLASSLTEQMSKAGQVFQGSASEVLAWSTTTADSLGVARVEALQAAGTFGNLLRTTGLASRAAAGMSTTLVELAADLASFNDTSPVDALEAIRSGLVGEVEPLRRYGVLLSAARVQQEAMRETGKTNAKQLTEGEKALARYNLILQQTKPAQGDFARTSSSAANAYRRLKANIKDLETSLGSTFVPTLAKATGALAAFTAGMNHALTAADLLDRATRDDIADAFGKDKLFEILNASPSAGLASRPDEGTRGPSDPKKPKKPGPPSPVMELPRGLGDVRAAAALTDTQTDDLGAARRVEGFWQTQLSRAKKGTEAYSRILQELVSAHRDVESFEDRMAAEQGRHDTAVTATRERAAREMRERRERQARIVAKALGTGPYATTSDGFNRAGVDPAFAAREQARRNGTKAESEAGMTIAEIRRMQFEFLQGLQGITNQFGSNITADGAQTATNTWQQARLMEEQNGILRNLASGTRHYGAKYARMELMQAFGGVGGI